MKTGVLLYEVHMAECPDIQAHPLLYHPIFISGFAFVTGKRHSSGQMFRTRCKLDMAVCLSGYHDEYAIKTPMERSTGCQSVMAGNGEKYWELLTLLSELLRIRIKSFVLLSIFVRKAELSQ